MKIEHNQPETQSKDLTTENIEQLKKLFPNIVEEGKVNFEVLRQLLGDEVVSEQEYYRFTWPGKHLARQEALKSSTGTLRPAKDESVDWDKTENLYIEGDNLEVLKLLQKSYFNKVKMIYIDPPYNTGKDFVYKDNYKDNLAEYNEKFNRTDAEGNVLSSETNNEGNARYHSNWLNMMYPRLQLARTLLKDDGVIFISIDDNEEYNLKRILDELFGESNFIASLAVQLNPRGRNLDQFIAKTHESILIYGKDISMSETMYGLEKEGRMIKEYNRKDELGPYRLIGLRNRNQAFNPVTRPNLFYPLYVEGKSGKISVNEESGFEIKVLPETADGTQTCWTWSKNKVEEENNLLLAEESSSGWRVYRKDYLFNEDGKTARTLPKSIWTDKEINNDYGKKQIKALFGKNIMDFPKSPFLLKKIIKTATQKDEIILDFFSGSSTTAHAVMDLNKRDLLEGKGGNRKYIMVQLPEPTDAKSEAYKAGYKTISEIGKERIRRAANQIKKELKDQPEVLEQLDLGFKVFKLDSSNIHTWDTAPEELENNLFRDEVIKEDRTAEDVLYEVLLKYGLDLTYPIEEVTLDNKKVYSVGAGQLIFCLEDGVTRDTAQAIIDWAKEDEIIDPKVVFKDAGFTSDVEKTNLIQLFKTHGVTDVKSI